MLKKLDPKYIRFIEWANVKGASLLYRECLADGIDNKHLEWKPIVTKRLNWRKYEYRIEPRQEQYYSHNYTQGSN